MKGDIYTADLHYTIGGNYTHWYPIDGNNCDSVAEAREVAQAWIRTHVEDETYADELCVLASALDVGDVLRVDECAGLNSPHELRIYAQEIEV